MKRAALLLLVACGPAVTHAQWDPPREEVVGWDACNDIAHCPNFRRFARPSDPLMGSVHWVISRSGHGCVVDDATFVLIHGGELYACNWRLPRP